MMRLGLGAGLAPYLAPLPSFIPAAFTAWGTPGIPNGLTDATLTLNQAAPLGGLGAVKLVEGTDVMGFPSINTVVDPAIRASLPYSYSVYAKAVERHILCLDSYFNNGEDDFASFDLTAGTVLETSGPITASIVSAGNGWWRCDISGVTVGGGTGFTNVDCVLAIDADVNPYTGDGVSGLLLFAPTLLQK